MCLCYVVRSAPGKAAPKASSSAQSEVPKAPAATKPASKAKGKAVDAGEHLTGRQCRDCTLSFTYLNQQGYL